MKVNPWGPHREEEEEEEEEEEGDDDNEKEGGGRRGGGGTFAAAEEEEEGRGHDNSQTVCPQVVADSTRTRKEQCNQRITR